MQLDAAALARLRALTVRARVLVQGALSGLHRASHRGSSVEFAEHKLYAPGDEIRHIDWKAYGKLGRYFVKQFDHESQLTVHLVLDASSSMRFAGGGPAKLDYAATLLAALAHLVTEQQDRLGVVIAGAQPGHDVVMPANGRVTLRDALAALSAPLDQAEEASLGNAATPAAALTHIAAQSRRRRALIVLASDLFDGSGATLDALRMLRATKHDVTVLHVLDPHERTFPYDGLTMFAALESEHRLLANPGAIRNEYQRRMNEFLAQTEAAMRTANIDYHLLSSGDAPEQALRNVLLTRQRYVRARGQ